MNKIITPKKAAEMLGVSTTTLRNWESAGKLMAIKTLGGHRRYRFEDIKKLNTFDKCK
jgi:excisionase family DNA binding protein